MLRELSSGTVVGLDHSATMRSMAARSVRRARRAIDPDLRIGDAQALPADLGTFDKIFSCNVCLFWRDPVAVFEQLAEHLAPGGTLAVTHLPRHGAATRETAMTAAADIAEQLKRSAYVDIRHEVLELDPVPAVCVLAIRS